MANQEGEFFGELLQRWRKRVGLTQAALAERIGAHRTTVSFWERGEYVPETLTAVLEIARVLHLAEPDTRLLVEARFGTASILPFHTLPEPNPYFTGRVRLLEQLHAALTPSESVALVQPLAISGLGGIGKTQLALAYAYRNRLHYHDILWAQAESLETLTASYLTFAEYLRLDLGAMAEQQRVVEAVKRWLREHKGWLLILDNLEDLHLVRAFVPTPRQGTVLLTTRSAETSPLARPLSLDGLGVADGSLFLLRRAGLLTLEASAAMASPQQRAAAQAIVEALGGLPLALDQAGAYMAETRCRLSDYLALVQQEQAALLARRGTVPSEHPASVKSTFALAFERVQQQSEAAGDLLKLCTYLAPESIPLDLFRQGGVVEMGPVLAPIGTQVLAFNAALETLQAYSLVRREAEVQTLSLHRLVQAVQQEILPEVEQRLWAERAVRLISLAFPTPDAATWERCQQLLPHALRCAESISRHGFAFPEASLLLHQAGRYLYQRGVYEPALVLLRQALALREQALGFDHPDVAETLDLQATLFWARGQPAEALPLSRRALALSEQALGHAHPDVAVRLNTLGLLYYEQGHYDQALPLFQRALAIREQAFGPQHPHVAESLNNLALLYRAQGQYEQALPLYLQALMIREQALDQMHPDVAESLNNLAVLYGLQGRYMEALPLFQQALAIREETMGPLHPEVAASLNNLARLYRTQGHFAQALPLYQRAQLIQEQTLGSDHPDVAWSLNIVAHLHRAQGQYDLALPLAQRGLAIREQSLGPVHPLVANSLSTVARLHAELGQHDLALPLAQRALAIREQVLGEAHPDMAESLNALARFHEAKGQDAEALPLVQRALAILQQALPDHPDTAATKEHLAALARRMEDMEAARAGERSGGNGTSHAH